jgi:hypothetical protein
MWREMTKVELNAGTMPTSRERITYVKQMLGELTHVARSERAELLVYLLEMAFTEACDLLGEGSSPQGKIDGYKSAAMAMKPSGKI